jgi:hypothetical protein
MYYKILLKIIYKIYPIDYKARRSIIYYSINIFYLICTFSWNILCTMTILYKGNHKLEFNMQIVYLFNFIISISFFYFICKLLINYGVYIYKNSLVFIRPIVPKILFINKSDIIDFKKESSSYRVFNFYYLEINYKIKNTLKTKKLFTIKPKNIDKIISYLYNESVDNSIITNEYYYIDIFNILIDLYVIILSIMFLVKLFS